MHCPSCGTRNSVGSQRCERCGYPFTRAAANETDRRGPRSREAPGYAAAYPVQTAPRRRRVGWLYALVALVVILTGLVIGVMLASNEIVKPMVADSVRDDLDAGIRTAVQNQVPTRVPETDGETSAAGEITVTEAEINQSIDDQGSFGPVDDINVQVQPEGVSLDLSAYGMSGTYSADLLVENGAVNLTNGELSGPLRFIVPEGELEQIANEAITRALQDTGYRIARVTLGDGAIRFELE